MPTTRTGLNFETTDIRPPWRRSQPGFGHPVVFHHGVGASLDMFAGWVGIVAEKHPIVRFDMRGFGNSSVPSESHRWTMDGLIADVIEVADAAFGPVPFHLVGESIGGTATLMTTVAHPKRVLSATVSNTPVKGAGIGYVRGWEDEVRRIGMKGWSDKLMRQRFVPGAVNEAQIAWLHSVQDRSPAHAVLGLGRVLADGDFRPGLGALKQPVLALMPDQSPYVHVSQAAELTELVPQSELVVFRGARHGLPLSHGPECARILVDFLDRVERGVRPTRRDQRID